MKRSSILLASILVIAGCGGAFRTRGPVTTEKRNVTGFNTIVSDAKAEVVLIHDSSTYLEVTTNKNLLPYVTTELENGTLRISEKDKFIFTSGSKISVEVHTASLDRIELSGVGSIKTENEFPFGKIKLELNGVGSMNISGSANSATLENSGTGSINARSLMADSVVASNSGVGNIVCNASKYLKADVSGVGNISYSGDAVVEKSVSGIGNIHKE